jgi:RsiW-degrading membrane proteinase PrsW (M82 family)
MSFDPILLAPEEEAREVYPYRRVWRTAALEVGVLLFGTLVVLAGDLFGFVQGGSSASLPRVGIAGLPLLAWFVFSYRGERRAAIPRPGLVGVLILGGLVANAVAVPLDERLFTLDRWLPQQGFFGRLLGYMFTLGFAAEFLKYLVLRYTVWPGRFRQRLDGVAYALAVSVGFAVIYNMRFALYTDATLTATALRVCSITYSHMAVGLVMGYYLAELRIGRPPVFWLPMGLLLAAFLSGLYYAFRGIAIVGGLNVGATASSPIRGLGLALGLVIVVFISLAFIIESADARMEALTGRRQTL